MLIDMPRYGLLLLCTLRFSLAQVITPAPSLDDLARRVGEKHLEAREVVTSGSIYNAGLRACYGSGAICGKSSPLFSQCNQDRAADQLLCWCTVGYYDARHECLLCQASASMIDSSSYSYEKSSDSLDCSSRIAAATKSGSSLASRSSTPTSTRSSASTDNDYSPFSYTYSSYRPSSTYTSYSGSESSSGGDISLSARRFPLGAIIGIVIGAIVFIGGIIAAILARKRHKRNVAAGLGPPQMANANPPPNPPPPSDPKTGYFGPTVVQAPSQMSPQPQNAPPPVSPMSSNYPPGYFPPPQQQQQGPPGYYPQQQPGMSASPPPQQTFTPPPGAPPPQNFSPPPGQPPQQQPYMWQGDNPQGGQVPAQYGAVGNRGPESGTAEIGGKEAPSNTAPRHEMGS